MTENTFSISLFSRINCIRVGLTVNYELFFSNLFDAVIDARVDALMAKGAGA